MTEPEKTPTPEENTRLSFAEKAICLAPGLMIALYFLFVLCGLGLGNPVVEIFAGILRFAILIAAAVGIVSCAFLWKQAPGRVSKRRLAIEAAILAIPFLYLILRRVLSLLSGLVGLLIMLAS